MMRLLKLVIAFTCVLITTNTKAQTNPAFAWISGADTVKSSGIYGALNTFAPTNLPPARQNSCSWNSNDQKLWLFGGSVTGSSGSNSYFNDLWAYDISSGQWAWISGANTPDQHGHYGTLGIASSANYPGARQNASTWTDHAGNFWLFGGQGFAAGGGIGYLSDLWKFDPTVNQWTWVAGSNVINQSDHFGTLGTPSSSNAPGARFGALSWYDDSSNKLYLFGGQKNGGTADRANDLWSYDISSAEWTWISGSNSNNQNGNYGTKGVAAAANVPGARQAAVAWKDKEGNFWLFGGYGFPESGSASYLNDLWKYDVHSAQWTWISGTNLTNQAASYGTLGTGAASNIPGARQMSISWVDAYGNFWLFGCWGYIGPPFGRINDLWKYNPQLNEWTWEGGSNSINHHGIYGVKGEASTSNIPGARRMAISWAKGNSLWLFGGSGFATTDSIGELNDLWSFDLNSTAIAKNNDNVDKLLCYPNPILNEIIIDCPTAETAHVKIYNSLGKLMFECEVVGKSNINSSSWPSGYYTLQFSNGQSIVLLKE